MVKTFPLSIVRETCLRMAKIILHLFTWSFIKNIYKKQHCFMKNFTLNIKYDKCQPVSSSKVAPHNSLWLVYKEMF